MLVKRYLVEDDTAWVEELCASEDNHATAIAQFSLVAIAAAFAAKLCGRSRFITPDKYERMPADLIHDARQRYQLVGADTTLVDSAAQFIRRQKLRGYNVTHLAGALALNILLVDNGSLSLTVACANGSIFWLFSGGHVRSFNSRSPQKTHRL